MFKLNSTFTNIVIFVPSIVGSLHIRVANNVFNLYKSFETFDEKDGQKLPYGVQVFLTSIYFHSEAETMYVTF